MTATQDGSGLRIRTDELDDLARLAVERLATSEKRLAYAPYVVNRLRQLKNELAQMKGDAETRRDKADEVARVEKLLKSIKD